MGNPYTHRYYNADFPNNTNFNDHGELIIIQSIVSESERKQINYIAAEFSYLLNKEWSLQDIAIKAKQLWNEGEIFNSGGNNILYGVRINPHVWVSVSDESYLVHYSKDEQIKLPWGQLTQFTEYYL